MAIPDFITCTLSYVMVNGLVFLLFAYDKAKARNNCWRISESALLVSAFFGPFGALGAMNLCRHKTRKMKFYLVPVVALVHFAAIVYLFWNLIHF